MKKSAFFFFWQKNFMLYNVNSHCNWAKILTSFFPEFLRTKIFYMCVWVHVGIRNRNNYA